MKYDRTNLGGINCNHSIFRMRILGTASIQHKIGTILQAFLRHPTFRAKMEVASKLQRKRLSCFAEMLPLPARITISLLTHQ